MFACSVRWRLSARVYSSSDAMMTKSAWAGSRNLGRIVNLAITAGGRFKITRGSRSKALCADKESRYFRLKTRSLRNCWTEELFKMFNKKINITSGVLPPDHMLAIRSRYVRVQWSQTGQRVFHSMAYSHVLVRNIRGTHAVRKRQNPR